MAAIQVPPSAVCFSLWRLHLNKGRNAEGRGFRNWRKERMRGAPDTRGVVVDTWPVSELDTTEILDAFGPGRYRVCFHDGTGNVQKEIGKSVEFQLAKVAEPAGEGVGAGSKKRPRERERSAPSELELLAAAAKGDKIGVVELLALLEAQRERNEANTSRAEARAREEADRRMQQDRQFFQMILGHAPAAAAPAAGIPVDTLSRELALMRRENSLTMREELAKMRAQFLEQQPVDDGADDPPPRNTTEALERAGMEAIAGLEQQAPGLVAEGLAAFRGWLRAKGHVATPEMVSALANAVRDQVTAELNGSDATHPE